MTRPVLALDLGSSSVRAVVFDAGLVPVASVRRSTAVWQDATGAATLDADAYLAATAECLDELHANGALAGVGTVAMSCQWHSLIPLDRHGRPVGLGLSWMDTRAALPAEPAPLDAAAFHHRTGAWWHALYWPVRIAWLRADGLPAVRWTGLGGYVAGRFLDTGGAVTVSEASGTGALDTIACRWDAEALALAGVTEDQVPPVAPDDWRGRLSNRAGEQLGDPTRRWPDLVGARWSLPVGDGAASAFGSGCVGPDRLSVTVGTSAAVRRIVPGAPEVPATAWRYRVDRARSALGIAYSGGGVLYDWAESLVGDPGEAALDALPPGAHGLVSLPYHAGHRPPLAAGATGTLHGLRLSTTAAEVVAATMEGACHELADGARVLDPDGTATAMLGGGAVAASPWLARRLAAAFGGSALRCLDPEVGARGAAALALGINPTPRIERVTVPPSDVELMAAAAQHYHTVRDALADLPPP